MTPTTELIHPDIARQTVLEHVPAPVAETVVLEAAVGRILAEDVVARDNHPPFPASTMDGYAVVAADASPWREVTGVQLAGRQLDFEVSDGYAVKVMTGAPVPRGADAVVRIEDIRETEDHIVIADVPVRSGQNIRPVGSDLALGSNVLTRGTRITPVELGLIATMGYESVSVGRRPRVAVISTGDELVDPGTHLEPGLIRDSNRFSLAASVTATGAEIVHSSRVSDKIDDLRQLLDGLDGRFDVLITSGGVSVGDRDLVKVVIGERATVHFQRVFMKPGKPLNFATAPGLLIFGLPGNPVSSMVSFEIFVRPALLQMQGAARIHREAASVVLATDAHRSDRIEYQRAVVSIDQSGRLVANSTGNQISSRLASMLGANALLVIDAGEGAIPAGETVPAMLLDVPLGQAGPI
jgi:gephyrin